MKHFPTINWALQVTHDPTQTILLPYCQYLAHVAANPEDLGLLTDMRVIIEEESLISGFKYVAMDIDDDKCLYLLYKLRKAIKKMQDHKGTVVNSDFAQEEAKVTTLIEKAWQKRGLYPSLPRILKRFLLDEDCAQLAAALVNATNPKHDLHALLTDITENEKVPEALEAHEDTLLDLTDTRSFKNNLAALVKLSLLNLTTYQIEKIVTDPTLMNGLPENPYILFEEYQADEDLHLDEPDLMDEPIDLYKVDVGMIPDRKFVKRHRELQNLKEDSPQRIRAVVADYLTRIGRSGGHCFDTVTNVLDDAEEHPLIYRNEIVIDRPAIMSLHDDYRSHFIEKLTMVPQDGTIYFYLRHILGDWARGDWESFYAKFGEPGVSRTMYDKQFPPEVKRTLAGMQIESLGEPQSGEGPTMWYVLCKVRFKDGREEEGRMHVAEVPGGAKRWIYKGGGP